MTPIISARGGLSSQAYGQFALSLAGGSYESIATVTIGATSQATISFTSIPSTYKHLQVRFIARTTVSGSDRCSLSVGINGDTGANYVNHNFFGDGASAGAAAYTGKTNLNNYIGGINAMTTSSSSANIFGVGVIDILDYTSTSKYKTFRALTGQDQNGSSGRLMFSSGFNTSITAAISSLEFNVNTDYSGNFAQYSHFALYGIKD
jgi:hypothetical protein